MTPGTRIQKEPGVVEGLALDRFVGPDGLMLPLSMIAERELPAQEVIELAKRVQIPGTNQCMSWFTMPLAKE
jgi:hypothetical protein